MTDTNNSNERLANDPHCDSIANGSVSHSHSLSSHRQSTGIYFGNASAGSGGGNARIQDLSTDASSESSTSQGWSYLSSPDEHHSNVDLADAEVDGLGIAMEGLSLYSPPVAGPLGKYGFWCSSFWHNCI